MSRVVESLKKGLSNLQQILNQPDLELNRGNQESCHSTFRSSRFCLHTSTEYSRKPNSQVLSSGFFTLTLRSKPSSLAVNLQSSQGCLVIKGKLSLSIIHFMASKGCRNLKASLSERRASWSSSASMASLLVISAGFLSFWCATIMYAIVSNRYTK